MGDNSLFIAGGVLLSTRACYWLAPTLQGLAATYEGTSVGDALEAVLGDVTRGSAAYLAGRGASADGSSEAACAEVVPPSPHDEIDSTEAADMLGVSPRRVVQIAEQLGGRKVAGRWQFDREAVLVHTQAKEAS